jgi:hypothetical protein
LKPFLGFFRHDRLTAFRAEGLKIPGVLQKAIESIQID